MPKTYTATSITRLAGLDFQVNGQGLLTGLWAKAEVNYGTKGQSETVNIWPLLTLAQQVAAQSLYNRVKALLEAEFLA